MNSLATLLSPNPKAENIPKNIRTKDATSDEKSNKLDFISILFSQIKVSSEVSSKQDIKIVPTDDKLDKSIKNSDKQKSSDELLLGDILNIVSLLKDSDKNSNFPKFSDKMDKILSNESIKNDFKNVKNLDDILKLSKKYDLGLKDIKFTKQSINNLKKDFPKLDIENFFNVDNNKKKDISTKSTNKIDIKSKNKSRYFTNNLETKSIDIKSKNENENTLQNILKKIDTKKPTTVSEKQNSVLNDGKDVKVDVENTGKVVEVDKKIDTKKPTTASEKQNSVLNIGKDVKEDVKNIGKVVHVDKKNQKSKHIKKTRTDKISETRNETKQNIQDDVLNQIKSQKHSNISNLEKNKSIVNENLSQDDSNTKIKKNQNSVSSHKQEFQTSSHIDNSKTNKQVKVNNSLNQFTNDLKEKVDAYKPPLMKVKMALNPKNLGEVEITLIHRGNNLHVNITSNTNTMSLFTQNQAEFKNSLVNMGFTNLEMNFSDQGKNSGQNQQNSKKNSASFEEYSNKDEQESSIELIVPRYI